MQLAASWRRQTWLIGVGVAASVVIALVVGLLFGRNIAGRLAKLTENVRRLGRKEGTDAASLDGRDEIARLDGVFRDMAQALAEQEQENEMFVYSVSHDLRSPLVNLQGFSEELSLSCRDLRAALVGREGTAGRRPDGQFWRKTSTIRSTSSKRRWRGCRHHRRAAAAVARRPGRVPVADAWTWRPTVRRSSMRCTTPSRRKKAEVVVGQLPPAWGDPTAVEQIFANLIGNAVPYLDPTRPGRVEVGALDAAAAGRSRRSTDVLCQGQRSGHSRGVPPASLHRPSAGSTRTWPRARASGWPWSVAWWSGSAVRSGWSPRPASAPRFSSPCRRGPGGPGGAGPRTSAPSKENVRP